MDGMHDKLNNGQPLNDEPHIKPRDGNRAVAMEIAEESIKEELKNINQIVPDARHFSLSAFINIFTHRRTRENYWNGSRIKTKQR